jgi:chromosome segregation ATPase
MEARVAALETHVGYIRRDIGELKADVSEMRRDIGMLRSEFGSDIGALRSDFRGEVEGLKISQATLTERVNHLPSKGFIVSATLSSLAIVTALILFQDHLKTIFSH